MELRHLRYFVAVAEHQNFSRAAEDLNVVQSALSRQIRDLENDLGTVLFERLARGVRLSPAGREFLPDAQQILDATRRAQDRARTSARGLSGKLTLAFTNICTRFPQVVHGINLLRQRYQGIDLRLQQLDTETQLKRLESGEIDAGFLSYLPAEAHWARSRPVVCQPYGLVLPRAHPLARREEGAEPIDLSSLVDQDFIFIAEAANSNLHRKFREACAAAGFQPRIVQEAVTEQGILGLVTAGIGIGFLPLTAAEYAGPALTVRAVRGLNVPMRIELAWHRQRQSASLGRFLDVLGDPMR